MPPLDQGPHPLYVVELSCTGRVSSGLGGLSANIPIEKLPPLICATTPPDLALAEAHHYRPLETRAVSTFDVHPSLLGSETVYGLDFPLYVLAECVQGSWLMTIVTPAVAPKTEVHEDWNRLFFLVTPIDAAHLTGFDIVRADVCVRHPFLYHSALVREGQLLPFESSAKTHVFELHALTWRECLMTHLDDDATYTIEITLSFFVKKEIRNYLTKEIPREIADMILVDLDLGSVVSLASTCKDLRASLLQTCAHLKHLQAARDKMATGATPTMIVMDDNIGRRVRQLFSTYFPDDPQGFRNLLGNTRAIVSGSSALHVLGNMAWVPGDLDVIVPGQTEIELRMFLMENGYSETSRFDHRGDPYVRRLARIHVIKFSRGENKIDVIVTDAFQDTPIEVALSHHSTPAMNYITATHVHCPFATLTFNSQMAFNLKERDFSAHGVKAAIRKYGMKRGFRLNEKGSLLPDVQWESMVNWMASY